ncbi:hypothetical protein JR316_0002828 [Psilocybe cubensis]|uniref:Uncharacterized protein n=2 Tax=Psilocybe cubensis TaxID=181762 RepID=A0A8H7Y8Z9_PSICU|nr:hypothetical protein JR316_0002828 [Psilocybe cubensis]KAH9485911.1 hypothetical protein JR316_0002828 [Psilocybe cubensis]
MNNTPAYVGPFFLLSNVYASSLLASLDRRERMRADIHSSRGVISIPLDYVTDQTPSTLAASRYTKTFKESDVTPSIHQSQSLRVSETADYDLEAEFGQDRSKNLKLPN